MGKDRDKDKDEGDIELSTPIPPPLTDAAQSARITPPVLPPRDGIPQSLLRQRGDKGAGATRTWTTITWPPALETHMITARFYDGAVAMTTTLPAHSSVNGTFFPNYTLSINTTTTRSPPTTVLGLEPPPPYTSGVSPYSNADGSGSSGPSKATQIRTWALVVAGVVLVALVGGLMLRRYRRRIGRAKKQEPVRHFMTVGEDDGESDRGDGIGPGGLGGGGGGGAGSSHINVSGLDGPGTSSLGGGAGIGSSGLETLPDGSIALSNLGASSSQQSYNNPTSSNNVRERRNSQPVPRQLELDGKLR
ncbi:hypothetical protein EMPS_11422 [Entomortierella parvispora]|uniref:Uncharacterized protein n=1 Tax=Entomortierella parvispora TaxID=205924 RepID=A0A9P3HM98_9FUNG|nr:hypothetical protein EMPS_11422 [Entomortierella parvispora]